MSKDVFWKSLILKVKNSFNLFTVNIYEVDQIAQFLRVCYLLSQLWVAKKYKPNKMISFSILFSILWKPTSVGTPTEAVCWKWCCCGCCWWDLCCSECCYFKCFCDFAAAAVDVAAVDAVADDDVNCSYGHHISMDDFAVGKCWECFCSGELLKMMLP